MKNIKTTTAIILTAALISVAVGWRVINHEYAIAPNLEIVTTVSVIAAIVLGTRAALAVPLITMIASDLIIGNSSIFIYTWSSFALIGLGALVLKKLNAKPGRQIATSFGFAIASSFAFFAITNFGVWAQGWYPSTLAGLTQCYINAIPFYRTMLVGNMILVPSAVAAWQLVRIKILAKQSVVNTFVR